MEIDKERRSLDLNRRPTIDDGVGDLPMNENEQEIEGILGNGKSLYIRIKVKTKRILRSDKYILRLCRYVY